MKQNAHEVFSKILKDFFSLLSPKNQHFYIENCTHPNSSSKRQLSNMRDRIIINYLSLPMTQKVAIRLRSNRSNTVKLHKKPKKLNCVVDRISRERIRENSHSIKKAFTALEISYQLCDRVEGEDFFVVEVWIDCIADAFCFVF